MTHGSAGGLPWWNYDEGGAGTLVHPCLSISGPLGEPRDPPCTSQSGHATAKPFRKDLPPQARIPAKVMAGPDLKDFVGNADNFM